MQPSDCLHLIQETAPLLLPPFGDYVGGISGEREDVMAGIERLARAALICVAGMVALATPSTKVVSVRAQCATAHLHPTLQFGRSIPTVLGQRPGVQAVAADNQGDVVWSIQGPPPTRKGQALRLGGLFTYNSRTGSITMLHSLHGQTTQRIGNLAISPRWIVFATSPDPFSFSGWQIVVRNRATGKEAVVATGGPGGLLAAQFCLDADVLVWVEPLPTGLIQIRDRNLVTGASNLLATVPGFNNVYDLVGADKGHVVWEWDHLVRRKPVSDILLTSETRGPIEFVTRDGQGSQPSLSWPRVAYVDRYRFGNSRTIVIQDLQNHHFWRVHSSGTIDAPILADSLLVYNPVGVGFLGLYNVVGEGRVVLYHQEQITVAGTFTNHFSPAHGLLASVGVPLYAYEGERNLNRYVLSVYRFHDRTALRDVLRCA